jgi:hypothetical protein
MGVLDTWNTASNRCGLCAVVDYYEELDGGSEDEAHQRYIGEQRMSERAYLDAYFTFEDKRSICLVTCKTCQMQWMHPKEKLAKIYFFLLNHSKAHDVKKVS